MTAMELVVFLLALVGAAIIGGVIDGVISSALRKRERAYKIKYNKTSAPITAGEVRAIERLCQEGRIKQQTTVLTPIDLKLLLNCRHFPASEPCAHCLGYSSEQEMREEE